MSPRVRPTGAAAAAAVERIVERRRRADDPDLHHLGDDPLGVLDYLRKHQRVAPEVRRADVVDALLITDHLRHELDRLRLDAIRAGRAAGMKLGDLAGPLGVSSRQGVEAAVRRLENAVAGGAKDEKAGRAERKRTRAQARWLAEHSGQLRTFAQALISHREQLADVADDLDDLASDMPAAGELVSPGFAAQLRLIVGDMAEAGTVVPASLRAAVRQAAAVLGSDPHRG